MKHMHAGESPVTKQAAPQERKSQQTDQEYSDFAVCGQAPAYDPLLASLLPHGLLLAAVWLRISRNGHILTLLRKQ